jgi:S-adenosylmethionine decarboxylase
MFEAACKDAGATVLFTKTHKFGEEGGTTGVVILAESHCSWHHYPESQSIMIDIFTCGDTNPSLALPRILEYFKPRLQNCQCIVRGKF